MSKIEEEYVVISIDETPLNTIEHSDYYWSSNHCRQLFKKRRKKTGINMIMAVGIDKIFHYSIGPGTNNAIKFWYFVNDLIGKLESMNQYKSKVRWEKFFYF